MKRQGRERSAKQYEAELEMTTRVGCWFS